MTTVAILGLGAMGTRMAQNLLLSGYSVVVYNRSSDKAAVLVEQGAIAASNPREAATQADIVLAMVTDNQASHDVWLAPDTGAVWGLTPNKIAIESSTVTLNWTRQLADKIAQTGAEFLDAPVVGSRPQAEAKQLIHLVGGEAATLAQVKPILQAAGAGAIHHVGTIGQGMLMKLAVNLLFSIQVAAMAETIVLLQQDAILPEKVLECLAQLPIISPAAKGAANLMVAENHNPLFPISLVAKDLDYVVQTAQTLQADTPIAMTTGDIYQQAIVKGYGDSNVTGIIDVFAGNSRE